MSFEAAPEDCTASSFAKLTIAAAIWPMTIGFIR